LRDNKYVRVALGFLVGFLFLYLSIRNVDWDEVGVLLENINYNWVLVAILAYWVELGFRIVRWRTLLARIEPPIPLRLINIAFICGYAANNVLPARLGELFRADLLGRLTNSSRLTVLGSIVVERLFDVLAVLAMSVWGVYFVTTADGSALDLVRNGLGLLILPVALLVMGILWFVYLPDNFLVARVKSISYHIGNLLRGLQVLEDPKSYISLTANTIILWALNGVAVWAVMLAIGVDLSAGETVLLMGISGIAAAIPAMPAGIGTLQYGFHLGGQLLSLPASVAIVGSTLLQVSLLGTATLVGAMVYGYAVSTHLLVEAEPEQP